MKRKSSAKKRTREAPAARSPGSRKHEAKIYREIRSNGASFWTLLDSGSRRTYVTRPVARHFAVQRLAKPVHRALGGRTYTIREFCAIGGTIEGYAITADALVVDRLFPDERGRSIDVILGMETMESWGIDLDNRNKKLDFRFYAKEGYEG